MKRNQSEHKRIHQTFSIPLDISNELRIYVKHREMSRFVSDAIKKELEVKKRELREEYKDMQSDPAQREVMKDWEATIGDGIDENEW